MVEHPYPQYETDTEESYTAQRAPDAPQGPIPTPPAGENPFAAAIGRRPVPQLKSNMRPPLSERFWKNFEAEYTQGGLLGSAGDSLTLAYIEREAALGRVHPYVAKRYRLGIEQKAKDFKEFPQFNSSIEAFTALTGAFAGATFTPENFIGPIRLGWRLGKAGYLKTQRALEFGLSSGGVNLAVDPVVQMLNIHRGIQNEFSWFRLAVGTAFGFTVGTGFGALKGRQEELYREALENSSEATVKAFNETVKALAKALDDAGEKGLSTDDVLEIAAKASKGDAPPAASKAADAEPATATTAEPAPAQAAKIDTDTPEGVAAAMKVMDEQEARINSDEPKRTVDDEPKEAAGTETRGDTTPRGDPDRVPLGLEERFELALAPRRPEQGVPRDNLNDIRALPLREIVLVLRKALQVPIRSGRFPHNFGARALGLFFPRSGAIRLRVIDDYDVLVHEGGHKLEANLRALSSADVNAFFNKHSKMLEEMAYPGTRPGHERTEGLAEYFRWWMTNPDWLDKTLQKQLHRGAAGFQDAEDIRIFRADFEAMMTKAAPKTFRALAQARDEYRRYLFQSSENFLRGRIVDPNDPNRKGYWRIAKEEGGGEAIQTWFRRAYTNFVGSDAPMTVAVRRLSKLYYQNMGAALNLPLSQDPSVLIRLAANSHARAMSWLSNGLTPYGRINPEGHSLAGALERVFGGTRWNKERLAEFESLLVAMRLVEEYARLLPGHPHPLARRPDAASAGEARQTIKDRLEQHPEWEEAAIMVSDFSNQLWRYKFEAGLIDEATYRSAIEDRTFHVPLMRDLSDKQLIGDEGSGSRVGGDDINKGTPPRRFRGDDRPILSPIFSLMMDAYDTSQKAAMNDTLRALRRIALMTRNAGGEILDWIPRTDIKATSVYVGDVLRAAIKSGDVDVRDAHLMQQALDLGHDLDGTAATIYRHVETVSRGERVAWIWDKGVRQPYRVGDTAIAKDLFDMLDHFGDESSNTFLNFVALPASALRAGVTMSPSFIAANLIRDWAAAWILTRDAFPVVTSIKGALAQTSDTAAARALSVLDNPVSEASTASVRRLMNEHGALFGGQEQTALNVKRMTTDFRDLESKGINVTRFTSTRELMGFMFKGTEFSETATRTGLFIAALKRGKSHGLSDQEALIEAAFTSRDYVDFGRHGSKMLWARKTIPFLNATIQGLDKALRVLGAEGSYRKAAAPYLDLVLNGQKSPSQLSRQDKERIKNSVAAWVKMSMLGMIGIAQSAIYKDDEDYRDISGYLRATHWMFKVDGRWVAVPKPFELAIMSNIMERAYEQSVAGNPLAMARLVEDTMKYALAPPHEPTAIIPLLEHAANKDFFTGRPIVDRGDDEVYSDHQYNSYTSELSKFLTSQMQEKAGIRMSPAILDHYLLSYTGSLGREAMAHLNGVMDKNAPKLGMEDSFFTRRFIRDISRGNESSKQFWVLMGRSDSEYNSASKTYKNTYINNGDEAGAASYLATLNEKQRTYVLSQNELDTDVARLHPLRWARDTQGAISRMKKDVRGGLIVDKHRKPLPVMSPSEKASVSERLSQMSMLVARNSLILIGENGWIGRKIADTDVILDEIKEISPAIHAELLTRLYSGAQKTVPQKFIVSNWPKVEEAIVSDGARARLAGVAARGKAASTSRRVRP